MPCSGLWAGRVVLPNNSDSMNSSGSSNGVEADSRDPRSLNRGPVSHNWLNLTPDSHNLFNLNRVSYSRSRNGSNPHGLLRKMAVRLSGQNPRSSMVLRGLAVCFADMGSVLVSVLGW